MATISTYNIKTYEQYKNMIKDKIILTDVDGVLLDWEFAFHVWMEKHGHTPIEDYKQIYSIAKRFSLSKEQSKRLTSSFNESASIGFLPPLRDSVYYVKKLHEQHGYVFHAITSLSTDPYAGKLREKNLVKLYGETTFEKVICLGTGADKDEALSPYRNTQCWWIEDKVKNAEVGKRLGLNSIIFEHGHNMDYEGDIPLAKNWESIYNLITNKSAERFTV